MRGGNKMSILKMMNIKNLIRILVCIILASFMVCFVPFPVWHNMTLQGSQVTKEGEVLDDATVKIRVWELHYLFKNNHLKGREDYLKGKVKITEGDMTTKIDYLGAIFCSEDICWTSLMYYNPESNSMCAGLFIFDKEFDTFQIFINDDRGNTTCYVVSQDEKMQPKEILERFQRIGISYWNEKTK